MSLPLYGHNFDQNQSSMIFNLIDLYQVAKSGHSHLITSGKSALNVNSMIYIVGTCVAIAWWTILPPLLSDEDQGLHDFYINSLESSN